MAAVGDNTSQEELDSLFRGIFVISKCLGLFPFCISHGKFRLSYFLFAISVGMIAMWSVVVYNFVDFHRLSKNDHLLKKLSHFLPIFTLFTVLPCNLLWLAANARKMTYVLKMLKTFKINVKKSISSIHKYTNIFIGVVVLEFLAECWYNAGVPRRSSTYIYLFMVLSTFLIADQFWSVLVVLRKYYTYICDNLVMETAVEFTNTHDLLAKCCHEVNDCYSPQLLLIMMSVFVYIVSVLYTLIMLYVEEKRTDFIQINYLVMFVTTIFHFLTGCRLTTLESKRFDNLLYRLIINDKSKSLMRNNRILLHFKAMKDLEFSAMEFFNFDYSLICSVVSTATTYIVILVQFS